MSHVQENQAMSLRLADERYEFIKGEVVALFERYQIRCVPISGFELAYKMGIKLIPYSSLSKKQYEAVMKVSTDGFYVEDKNGRDIIYYNDTVVYERINMTILHEIGHCVLDHQGSSEEEEVEAKFFAKYAAAPPPLLHHLQSALPENVAGIFCITYTAAVYACNYYHKWLEYGETSYKDYELRLLALFFDAKTNGEQRYVCIRTKKKPH